MFVTAGCQGGELGADLDTRKEKNSIASCPPRSNRRLLWINTSLPSLTKHAASTVVVACCVGVPGWCQNASRPATLTLEWGRPGWQNGIFTKETSVVLMSVISKTNHKNLHDCSMTHATFRVVLSLFFPHSLWLPLSLLPPPHSGGFYKLTHSWHRGTPSTGS